MDEVVDDGRLPPELSVGPSDRDCQHRLVSRSGPSPGGTVALSPAKGRAALLSWGWRRCEPPRVGVASAGAGG